MEKHATSSQKRKVQRRDRFLSGAVDELQSGLRDICSRISKVRVDTNVLCCIASLLTLSKNPDLQSICLSNIFDSLDKETKSIITALLDHNNRTTKEIATKVSEQTLNLLQVVRRLEVVNADQH